VSGSNECLVDLYAHALNRRSQISRQTTARHPLLWAHALSPILWGHCGRCAAGSAAQEALSCCLNMAAAIGRPRRLARSPRSKVAAHLGCQWNREPLENVLKAGLVPSAATRGFLGMVHVIQASV
jgi:hypothetical protein